MTENPYASPPPVVEEVMVEELPGPRKSLVGTARGIVWIAAGIAAFPVGMIVSWLAFPGTAPVYGGLPAACVLHAVGLTYCWCAAKNLVRGGRMLVLTSSILMAIGVGLYVRAIPVLTHAIMLPYGYPALAVGGLLWQVYLIRLATTLRCGRLHAWLVLLTFLSAWAAVYLNEIAGSTIVGYRPWRNPTLAEMLSPYGRAMQTASVLLPLGFLLTYLTLLVRIYERLWKLIRQPEAERVKNEKCRKRNHFTFCI